MTLKEYLNNKIEITREVKEDYERKDDMEMAAYFEGCKDTFETVQAMLSRLDHDVTVREVVAECLKHENDRGCADCTLRREHSSSSPYYCGVGGMPAGWGIDEIQKRMKEARK